MSVWLSESGRDNESAGSWAVELRNESRSGSMSPIRFISFWWLYWLLWLEFSENLVHYPVGWSCADGVAFAGGFSSEVVDDGLDEWELHVFGIGDYEFLSSFFGVECHGCVVEY